MFSEFHAHKKKKKNPLRQKDKHEYAFSVPD